MLVYSSNGAEIAREVEERKILFSCPDIVLPFVHAVHEKVKVSGAHVFRGSEHTYHDDVYNHERA